ncbi:MAG TPA: aminotransferase class V-fold PLP-dependent enzyme [Cyclobacteriaceae bacterium]
MSEVFSVDSSIDIQSIRKQFPILHQEVNKKPLIYFDNAATSQKPKVVIDALVDYYQKDNANIHRGIHTLAERATNAFEETRKAARDFINANEPEEIVFTKGTTEGINLVANSFGRKFLNEGDEIIISGMEHHSNIVPWQLIRDEKNLKLKIVPVLENGELDLDGFKSLLTERTKLVSMVHISNTLGTINPVSEVVRLAHNVGAKVLIDGAQAAPHTDINVMDLNADFYVFSAHKVYGPTGVGVLYGKRDLLEAMPPYQGGGEMIKDVHFDKTTFNDIPYKFEAGTPNIGEVIAFQKALAFVSEIGKDKIRKHEEDLLNYATDKIKSIKGLKILGEASNKASVISFTVKNVHHFDIGVMLDAKGIAVRTGHHCTQPLMERYNIEGTARASFAIYNTKNEIDSFIDGLDQIIKKFN